ncbi:MAG: RNA chaperone Hfq [Alphaproteobacteria bacterium]|nr:RNA chaperone Hfq [Alphaproteobacteria bacterium]
MADKPQNVQDVFLNTVRKKRVPVTVFLANGVKLQGNITSFDNFSLLLRRGPQVQLVYKHTIATVVPSATVTLQDEEGVEEALASEA